MKAKLPRALSLNYVGIYVCGHARVLPAYDTLRREIWEMYPLPAVVNERIFSRHAHKQTHEWVAFMRSCAFVRVHFVHFVPP